MDALPPTRRDVEAAWRLALAELRDLRRCRAEFGPNHPVTRVAVAAYAAAETHWRETSARFDALPPERRA